MINKITLEIIKELKKTAPKLTTEQIDRRNRIINSSNPKFIGYGHKISDIEKITRKLYNNAQCNFEDSLGVFKNLISSNVLEEKFAGVFFLNNFKSKFNQDIIELFENTFSKYCDTWAFCDTSCIRVIGPFLGKRNNQQLADKTINEWSKSENLWVRRASMVILLKIIMIKKEFNEDYIFKIVDQVLKYTDDYTQKGIGWLLKTCSKYKPKAIINYLMSNKERLPRLILRYASEKLPKEKIVLILKRK